MHAVLDGLGNPVCFSFTPAQASDLSQAEPLLDEIEPRAFLADKAYDADALDPGSRTTRHRIRHPAQGQPRRPAQMRLRPLSRAHLVEWFFNRLNFRAVATRYDKLAQHSLAAVHLITAIMLLN